MFASPHPLICPGCFKRVRVYIPKGGEGSVLRTLAGAIVIGVIQVVLVLQGLRTEWQYLIAGLIVLGVIALQTPGTRD